MSNVLFGGAHRGALSIVNELQDKTVRQYDPHWKLADPKDDRAVHLGKFARNRFPTLRPQPHQMRVQDALAFSHDHDSVVLALDTVSDIADTLAARRSSQRALFQFAGRGQGGSEGTRLAFQGTISREDQATESEALLLLQTLDGMSQATSSRNLTGPDPLTAAVLQTLRQATSRQTARHLDERDREPWDLTGGPLSVAFGQTVHPLFPVQGGAQDTYAQRTALALEHAGGLPVQHVLARGVPGCMVVVAIVIPQARAIHFLKVAQNRTGKRSIAGVTTFQSPRVRPSSSIDSAVFTD
jgi:hypothetical protein